MSTNHFVVSERDSAWQYSYRGDVTAPFATREKAIHAAIAEATSTRLTDVEVIVHHADLKTESVWKPRTRAN